MLILNTLILPGSSVKNRDWAIEANEFLKPEIPCWIYEWTHWSMGTEADFNSAVERDKILSLVGSQPVNILAKSIGTLITCLLLEKIPNQINKVILCGIPSGIATSNENNYREALGSVPVQKIIFFQNDQDPYGNFSFVSEFVAKINPNFQVRSMPRSDHHYPYYQDFKDFLFHQETTSFQ